MFSVFLHTPKGRKIPTKTKLDILMVLFLQDGS